MLDDIGKAEPHMATAVPTMGVDNVWNNHGIYGEGVSIAIVDTGVNNAHEGLDDLDDNQGLEKFDVYFWTNSIDSAIVEWDNVANGQTDENCVINEVNSCKKESFQLIITNASINDKKESRQ